LYTYQVRSEAEDFAARRDNLAKARTRNINFLEQSTLTAEQRNTNQLHVWRLASAGNRLALYEGVLDGSARIAAQQDELAKLREGHAQAVSTIRSRLTIRSQKLGEASKALAQLAEKIDTEADLQFYLAFFRQVRESLERTAEAVGQEVDDAVAEADQAVPEGGR
jgi:ElaB/YqjD/DUF883 family membrane-anchored ribosome-binding protein